MPRDADHLLVSGAQMAQLEQQLFASGLPVEALMEKAALLVARHLLDHEPLQAGALVLVGPGHNGGDALVVKRWLVEAERELRIRLGRKPTEGERHGDAPFQEALRQFKHASQVLFVATSVANWND